MARVSTKQELRKTSSANLAAVPRRAHGRNVHHTLHHVGGVLHRRRQRRQGRPEVDHHRPRGLVAAGLVEGLEGEELAGLGRGRQRPFPEARRPVCDAQRPPLGAERRVLRPADHPKARARSCAKRKNAKLTTQHLNMGRHASTTERRRLTVPVKCEFVSVHVAAQASKLGATAVVQNILPRHHYRNEGKHETEKQLKHVGTNTPNGSRAPTTGGAKEGAEVGSV
jgi:hypothetical protein